MFSKPKGWLSGGLWKPKNPHSLEHLKYLYGLLCKNQIVTENNSHLLVETLRSISEILIWGDQNDSTVFDFFLEKNMLSFFLRFMRQKCGRYICVQLLQTLNILFENISNETSVYYLLSNNHINSIIVHKFDFSDEEVMAYYISFLKTLSLKLNKHTIHFFYNEHTNDFALYTEAIKFFNHSESMVRIAVRTITLNVYKVDDRSMLRYIRDKTAAPYFSNLVWFIGNHIIDLDACVRNDADHNSRDRLADLVAEHLDHLHYLNDIVCLGIDALNGVLTDHLLNRLLIPLYVYSLTKRRKYTASTDERPHVSSVVSLFLLSQVFLIISHCPLVRQLADIIFNGDMDVCADPKDHSPKTGRKLRGFVKPVESLAQTLDNSKGPTKPRRKRPNYRNSDGATSTEAVGEDQIDEEQVGEDEQKEEDLEETRKEEQTDGAANAEEEKVAEGEVNSCTSSPVLPAKEVTSPNQNSTDEEKLASIVECSQADFSLTNRPYLEALFNALECSDNDYEALFALCLLYAMGHNTGIHQELLDTVFMPTDKSEAKDHYNITLVEKLIKIISLTCQNNSKVRLATMEMSIVLMKQLVYQDATRACYLQDRHLAALEGAREEGALLLRNFYKVWEKSEEIFLDMFEDEYREMKNRPLNVEYLMMDASILLPPTGTPLTGIDFNKRLPCGEVERARRAIRVFFMLRDLSLTLRQEPEAQLPLTKNEECVKVNDVLDLNNSDLIACTVITKDSSTGSNKKERRFLVIDVLQLILVEPDTRRLGWGVVKFVGFLQDVEVTGDKDDSRSLHITIHKPSMNVHARPLPLLSARFVFDDHIRCMAAKQRLTKGRLRARQRKMQMIARLLELPTNVVDSMYQPPAYTQSAAALRTAQSSATAIPGRSHPVRMHPRLDQGVQRPQSEAVQKSVFASVSHLHAFHSAREKDQHRSKPIAIRGGQSSRVRREAQHVASGAVPDSSGSSRRHQGSPEVEQAEEATPSPEAHAFQSLNPPQAAVQEPKSGRQSRNGSTERTDPMEIPLEDMSKKNRGSAAAELLSKQGDSQSHSRSTSYSPRRRRNSPSGSPRLKGSPISSLERSRPESRTETRKRAGSHPSPRTSRIPVGEARGRSSNVSNTSFTVQPKSECESDAAKAKTGSTSQSVTVDQVERKKGQEVVQRRRRSSSGTGPKTLTPAPEPAVSLIISSDVQAATCQDSPKLRPPAELERIRSLSDASSTDTEPKMSSSKEAKVGVADEPKPDCLEDVEQSGKHTDSKVNVEIAESLKSSQVSNSDRLDTDNPPVCATTTQTTSRSNDTRIESINKPPFRLSKETEPTTVINNTGADLSSLDRSSPVEERAMQQLSKIAQKARQVYTLKQEAGSIELTHQEAAPVQEPSEEQTENCESTITSDSTVTANKKKEETEAEEETRATEEKTRLEVATEDNVKTELVDLEDQPESQELSTSECKDVIEESKNCETTDKTEKS